MKLYLFDEAKEVERCTADTTFTLQTQTLQDIAASCPGAMFEV
jgi:hypothetical protein